MLIKEYRIPLPMSVEEYRIAQLYMIQVCFVAITSRKNSKIIFKSYVILLVENYCLSQKNLKLLLRLEIIKDHSIFQ